MLGIREDLYFRDERYATLLKAILARLNVGVMAMTPDGELAAANARAMDLIAGTPIRIVDDRLIVDGMLSAALRRMIERAAASDPPPPMTITMQDGVRLLVIAAEQAVADDGAPNLILLWLSDYAGRAPDCSWMREAFRLTCAELAVVERVAQGMGPEQIAEASGISVATVRSHLLRVYGKTNVGSQAGLVRLAHLLPLTAPA